LVPGVITLIEPIATEEDTADGPREFSELLSTLQLPDWQPHYAPVTQTLREKAKAVTFRRPIWNLEFGFKPMRMVTIDDKPVWYLMYYVRNHGQHHYPQQQKDQTYVIQPVNHDVRFVPSFVLESLDQNQAYADRILPRAVAKIAERERPPGRLYDSATIGSVSIPVSTDQEDHRVWGVATWDQVDPYTDFFSVYVQGLTNAYRWQPPAAGYSKDFSGNQERLLLKTLRLNFWRPGDEIRLHEGEIRYGVPLYPDDPPRQQEALAVYGLAKPLEYEWVYREVRLDRDGA
jgi:hypothetical protein